MKLVYHNYQPSILLPQHFVVCHEKLKMCANLSDQDFLTRVQCYSGLDYMYMYQFSSIIGLGCANYKINVCT